MRDDKNAALKERTKKFALRAVKVVKALPRTVEGQIFGRQLLRSASSVGANYRAACKSRSLPDFISKIGVVEEEADESAFWLELIVASGLIDEKLMAGILKEANELTAIMGASRKTAQIRRPPKS